MKKLLLLSLLFITTATITSAQSAKYWYGSNKVQLTQYPVSTNESYMFPTWDAQDAVFGGDTTTISLTQYETYVKQDSINRTSLIILSPSSNVLAGAKVYLVPTSSNDSARTLYVKQGATVVDTVTVNTSKQKRSYWYDGTVFRPFYK